MQTMDSKVIFPLDQEGVRKHVRILGLVLVARSGLILSSSVMLLLLIGVSGDVSLADTVDWSQRLNVALSIPTLVAGMGLLQLRSWGRSFGLVISAALLPLPPFGT